jgi:hypothetical protein
VETSTVVIQSLYFVPRLTALELLANLRYLLKSFGVDRLTLGIAVLAKLTQTARLQTLTDSEAQKE